MDFELPGEDHPERKAIRAWFEANPEPSGLALAQAGFVVPHWPRPWGLEADAELQLIIDQELKRAGVHIPRNPVAINNCAQSLLTHGSEAQRQHFLWPALSGEHTWCMLFSEPSGGSDLARCAPSLGATAITMSSKDTRSGRLSLTRRRSACWSRALSPTCPSTRACRNS
jgi:alkylation response protein AidB-like acyl-CoA dehydrogenase